MRKTLSLVLFGLIWAGVWVGVVFSTPAHAPAPAIEPSLWDGLVSYWKLDEESGVRYDSWGDNDLTDNNTVGFTTTSILGNAADFIATNHEYLSRSDNPSLSMGDVDFSISAWMHFDSILPGTLQPRIIVSKGDAGLYSNEYFLGLDGDYNKFTFYVGNNNIGHNVYVWSQEVISGTHFIVAWHDSVHDIVSIQVDNSTIYTESYEYGSYDSNITFRIGNVGAYWDDFYSNYPIDEVGMWKRILSSEERCALYNGGNGMAFPFNNPVPSCDYIVHGDLGDVDLCDSLDDDTPWNTGNGATIANGEAAIPPGGVIWHTAWPSSDVLSIYAKSTSEQQDTVILDWMGQNDNEQIYNNDTFHEYSIYLTNTGMTGTLTLAGSEENLDTITVTEICRYSYAPVSPLPTPVSPLPTPAPTWDPYRLYQSETDDITSSPVDTETLCLNGGNLLVNGDFETGQWPWRCDWSDYRLPQQAAIWDSFGWVTHNKILPYYDYYSGVAWTNSYYYDSIAGCQAFGQYVSGLRPGTYTLAYDVALDSYGDTIPNTAYVEGIIKRPGCAGESCALYYSNTGGSNIYDKDYYPGYTTTYRITQTIVIPEYPQPSNNLFENGSFENGDTGWITKTEFYLMPGGLETDGTMAIVDHNTSLGYIYQDFTWPGGDLYLSAFGLSYSSGALYSIIIENVGTGEKMILCNTCSNPYGLESSRIWYDAQAGTYRFYLIADSGTIQFDGVWADSAGNNVQPNNYFVGIQNQHVQKPIGGSLPTYDYNTDDISVLYLDNVVLCTASQPKKVSSPRYRPFAFLGIPTDVPEEQPIESGNKILNPDFETEPDYLSSWIKPGFGHAAMMGGSCPFGCGMTAFIQPSLFSKYQQSFTWSGGNLYYSAWTYADGTNAIVSIEDSIGNGYIISNDYTYWNQQSNMWGGAGAGTYTITLMCDNADAWGCYFDHVWVGEYEDPGCGLFCGLNTATPYPTTTGTPSATPTHSPTPPLTQTPTRTPQPTYTGSPLPSNTPPPPQTPTATTPPETPTPQASHTPGGPPTETPTAGPTRTPYSVPTVPYGPSATPLSLPPSYICQDGISSITQWDRQAGVTLIEDADYIYYARLNINEYVYRPFYLQAGKHLLTFQARCNAYSSQAVIINVESRSPYGGLYNQSAYQNVPCNVSGWIQALFEFNVPAGGAYTLYITNIGGGTFYYDVDIKSPCMVIEGGPATSTPFPGAGTSTPIGTSTPGTPMATATWGPLATSTPGPGSQTGGDYHYSPPEAGFCDGNAPDFPAYGGYCQEGYAGNWWQLPQLWLCLLWDLIQRLFMWLGQFLQWLLCPVFDILYWIMCLMSTLSTIAGNLWCWVRHQWDFFTGLWNGFWS